MHMARKGLPQAYFTQQEQEFLSFLLSKLSDCRMIRFMGARRLTLIGHPLCGVRENPYRTLPQASFGESYPDFEWLW
jgi:hypothetical protein